METYIALLRGINVSGHKPVPMQALKALFENLDFQQVRTYIQSGNVVFRAEKADPAALAARVEEKIAAQFGFHVPVLVRRAAEIQQALDRNPFLQQPGVEPDKLHVTFLADEPEPERSSKLAGGNYGADQYHISEREVFLYCPQGYGNTKLHNAFLETKLGRQATTRNLKTVRQLLGMAEADKA
ncbi:MAG: DUF1697 domain-containing protein [Adhaeribacter sp.]